MKINHFHWFVVGITAVFIGMLLYGAGMVSEGQAWCNRLESFDGWEAMRCIDILR